MVDARKKLLVGLINLTSRGRKKPPLVELKLRF